MWLKGLGGVLLVAVSVSYAAVYARRMRMAQARLSVWLCILNTVKQSISCFGAPLSRIYEDLSQDDRALLIEGAGEPCQDICSLCRVSAYNLSGESKELLLNLSREIGTLWRQEQLGRLDYYIAALEKEKERLQAHAEERVKIHSTLSVCAALGLVLLFW